MELLKAEKETSIQNKIRIALSDYGVVIRLNVGVFKTADGRFINGGIPNGFPDLLFLGDGLAAFFEVKSAGGRISAGQKAAHKRLRELNQNVFIVKSAEEAIKIVKEIMRNGVSD